ncbi:MAG: hypothetical protein QOD60_415 [Solirubrobacterales bacterium]|nr:hypothetical protein [Solirubrobacterales bacterium]
MSRVMVPGYTHTPGNHCGSTALRNLLAFHGAEISEEMAFGLGAGACFFYIALDGQSPSRFTNGRGARLEETFVELTGAPLRLETDEDEGRAWGIARAAVDAGRPALLLSDLYYLDHYGNSAHFPGHAVVLAGYDDEVAYLSDTAFEELQTTSLENLAKARHSKHPAYPLAGQMLHLPDGKEVGDLGAAIPAAVARAVKEMEEPAMGEFQGLPALRRLAVEIGDWPEAAEDWQWCARFLYQVIERRGTGGGNFRRMYARFLEEAGYQQFELCDEAANRWTSVAEAARAASEADEPKPELWKILGEDTSRVLEIEERLWQSLA